VAHLQQQHNQLTVLDVANQPVVTHAVAPKAKDSFSFEAM
jgi:hypothetical protein